MKFPCQISQLTDGTYCLKYTDQELGKVEVTAPTEEIAIDKMRGELRYRLEICPCTGKLYEDTSIEIQLS